MAAPSATRIGVVDGPPWIAGGPPAHAPWAAITALDATSDIVPIALDGRDPPVDVLIVPLVHALSRAQLDVLASNIDLGTPALLVVDPLPLSTPGASPSARGPHHAHASSSADANAFLAGFGVEWRDDVVLGVRELEVRPGGELLARESVPAAPTRNAALQGLRTVYLKWGGAMSARPGATFEPLLTTAVDVDANPAAAYLSLYRDGWGLMMPPPGTDRTPVTGRPVVIARVRRADEASGRVIVATDIDMFDAGVAESGGPARDNHLLLPALVADLLGRTPSATAATVTTGGSFLERATDVASIEITDRDWLRVADGDSDDSQQPQKQLRVLRVRRGERGWIAMSPAVDTPFAASSMPSTRAVVPGRIDALLTALVAARFGDAESRRLPLPGDDDESATVRVVARAADGTTVLDVVLDDTPSTLGVRAVRATHGETVFATKISVHLGADVDTIGGPPVPYGPKPERRSAPAHEPPPPPAPIGFTPDQILRVVYRHHRVDIASARLVNPRELTFTRAADGTWTAAHGHARSAAVTAWIGALASLAPAANARASSSDSGPVLVPSMERQERGFFVNHLGTIVGAHGEVEVVTEARTYRIVFGEASGSADAESPHRNIWLVCDPPLSGTWSQYELSITADAFAAVHPAPQALEQR